MRTKAAAIIEVEIVFGLTLLLVALFGLMHVIDLGAVVGGGWKPLWWWGL